MSKKKDAAEAAAELKKLTEAIDLALPGGVKAAKKGQAPPHGVAVNHEIGRATRFQKGNKRPGPGRPRAGLMTEALQRRLTMRFPAKYAKVMGLPKGLTWADAVAWTALYGVVKAPSATEFDGYANRADGRQVREISGPGGAPIPLDLGGEVYDQFQALTGRVRDRIKDAHGAQS
jgi:hypothetical protein